MILADPALAARANAKNLDMTNPQQKALLTSEPQTPPLTPISSDRSLTMTLPADDIAQEDLMGRAFIMGTGSAFGKYHFTEQQMAQAFHNQREACGDTTYDKAFVDRLFSRLQFDFHSVQLPLEDVFRRFTRREYIEFRRVNLLDIAERAARQALKDWGGDPADITHLYWGTMTGAMDSPTMDILLTKNLGLNYDVERTSIEGMGCLTGYRLTNLAKQISRGDPDARILVVSADLRSLLGNSLPLDLCKADIVTAALFRDAGSACVVGGGPLRANEKRDYEIMGGKSRIIRDSQFLADYQELDGGGIRLHLSKDLPEGVEKAEGDFVASMLKDVGKYQARLPSQKIAVPASLEAFDIACHTGGPKILRCVGRGLGLDDEDHMKASWNVMKAHGNLSGASNLSVLDEQNHRIANGGREWVACLSMGPGVAIEGLILHRPKNYSMRLKAVVAQEEEEEATA